MNPNNNVFNPNGNDPLKAPQNPFFNMGGGSSASLFNNMGNK